MLNPNPHTFDIHLKYHCCPFCSNIIESRNNYFYRLGKWIKELNCPKCGKQFTVLKRETPQIGPLFGIAQPPETDWKNG